MKKWSFMPFLAALIFLFGCSGSNGDDTVKLGFIGPLTGGAAGIGQEQKHVVEMYFKEHPVWAGKKIAVVYEDAQCNGQNAASAAQKLINADGVEFILGGLCSGETLGAAPIAEENRVLLFSSTSTSPEVSTAGDYVFRNSPSDVASTDLLAKVVSEKYSKVALLSQNNDFAQAYSRALREKLPAAGVSIVADEEFVSETTDFKTALTKIRASGAEVLLNISGETAPAGLINRQAKELGLKLPIYGTDALAGKEFFEIAKDAAEGTIIVIVSANKNRSGVEDLLSRYSESYGEAVAEAFILLGWDRMEILRRAVEEVGFDSDSIRDWLYAMPVYEGLAGSTEFDANGDSTILPSLMVAKDGAFVHLQ